MRLFSLLVLVAIFYHASAYNCTTYDPTTRTSTCSSGATPSSYVPQPYPSNWLGACHINDVPSTLTSTIQTIFPEGKHPDPSLISGNVIAYISLPNTNLSMSFAYQGAGYTNRNGFAVYDPVSHTVSSVTYIFPKINNMAGVGCLTTGDTYKFGPFSNGQEIIFFLDPNSGSTRLWSYLDPPYWTNPDTNVCSPNGCVHTSWVYLPKEDINIFGFEDQSLGDADYNDFMFFLQFEGGGNVPGIPSYGGGTIQVCNTQTGVSSNSYAEVNCTQWGLLESTTTRSCLTYMSIPEGWTWARYDDAAAVAVIPTLASQWSYTSAACFILQFNATSGVGYTPNGAPCAMADATVNVLYNGTTVCYNSKCTSRFVLRGADLGVACSSASRCLPGTSGSILATAPSSTVGATQFPTAYSVYLASGSGTVGVSTSIQLPTSSGALQLLDVMVLADFSNVPATSTKQQSIISSWSNLASTFASNNIDATIGFAQYTPSSAAPYYTVTSSYTLSANPPALTTNNFPTTTNTACPASGRLKLLAAMKDVMYNNAINWRGVSAFKILWVFSLCPIDLTTDIYSAGVATGIVPVMVYPASGSYPSGWSNTGAYAVPLQTSYKTASSSSNQWMNPFASSNTMGAGLLKAFPTYVFGVPYGGDTAFFSGLPTSPVATSGSGVGTLSFNIAWPSSYAYNSSISGYATSLSIMGRSMTTFAISFNHPPTVTAVSYFFVANVNQTITFAPSDPDGNLMNLIVRSLPTMGTLYTPSGTAVTTNAALTLGVYQLIYVPNALASGQDSFNVDVSDGCVSTSTKCTLSLTYANNPPVAQDFTVYIVEDSLPTGTNGIVDFTTHISDVDIAAGQAQSLTVQLISLPSPSTDGTLTSGSNYKALSVGAMTGYVARYNLTQPRSGYGTITFQYQVSDGTSQGNSLSNIATVTIVIIHVNHAPILTITPTSFSIQAPSASISISGSITDYDNDLVNLYAVGKNLPTFTVAADNSLQASSTATFATPFPFYSSNQSTSPNELFSLTNLNWVTPTGASKEWVLFAAQDQYGAWSNTVNVTFQTVTSNPPVWVSRPINSSFTGPFSITQGTSLSNLYFSATDADSNQYATLIFDMITPPASGVVTLLPLSSGGNSLTAVNGTDYSNPLDSTIIGINSGSSISFYSASYTPFSSFYGTDVFTFSVRDITGLYASQAATVTVNVLRKNTPPVSVDSVIKTSEQVPGSVSIPLYSTNDPSDNVLLTLVSVNFPGSLTLEDGSTWTPGTNTSIVNSNINNGLIQVTATSVFAGWSAAGVPTGNFTYIVYEPGTNLVSTVTYNCQIYVAHVNHPPTSQSRSDTVKKGTPLMVTLYANDPDADDTPPTNVTAYFRSISVSSKGSFFFDQAMTRPLTATQLDTPLVARTFWYLSTTDFSNPISTPLASYSWIVVDSHGLPSTSSYTGSIIVTYQGTVPTYGGNLLVTTYQETPVPMALATGDQTESGANAFVTITTLPTRGTFAACDDSGICTRVASVPYVVTSTAGRVVFIPQAYDWDSPFTNFNFTLTDPLSGAVGLFTMVIDVIHVNKPPVIEASNFLTSAETNGGIIINESNWLSFDWKVHDVDSMPASLSTGIRVAFYTSKGFSLYSCTYSSGDWNTPTCAFTTKDVPLATRANFAKNAQITVTPYETVTTSCPDFTTLRSLMGQVTTGCEAHFKFAFAPTPLATFTPYVSITFFGIDDYGAASPSISALIYVKALNQPPTIWSPALVLGGTGVSNPFILDTSTDSSTYNNPVSVGDIDNNGHKELLIISVLSGYSGSLIWPSSAPCSADPVVSMQWNCLDYIPSFNNWLRDIRFEVTSGQRADIQFTINDLGWTSDYAPSPNLTASSVTSVRLTAAIAAPKGNSSTLAIAVGVAAGVGLLLLGALGFFLRRAVQPPTEDYFAAATTPLSAAPQSPLYQAQNQEHTSALYKGK